MRVVVRVYRDGRTKPHHEEYKTDCEDERRVLDVSEDIESFLQQCYAELEDVNDEANG